MQNDNIHTSEDCIKLLNYTSESATEIMDKLAPNVLEEIEKEFTEFSIFYKPTKSMLKPNIKYLF